MILNSVNRFDYQSFKNKKKNKVATKNTICYISLKRCLLMINEFSKVDDIQLFIKKGDIIENKLS